MSTASSEIEQPVPICSCECCCKEPQDYGIEAEGTVRTATGQLMPIVGEADISVAGFGFDLGITRSYNNRAASEDVGFGKGWLVAELPQLVEDTSLVMIEGASNDTLYFDEQSDGSYVAKYYSLQKLEHDSGAGEYTLTEPDGSQRVFEDTNGTLTKIVDRYGNEASVDYDSSGNLDKISYSTGASGQSVEYRFAWSGTQVSTVTLLVDAAEARKVTYTYLSGKLVTVTVEDKSGFFSGWKEVRQTYYRYDSSDRLKYVLKDEAYKQAASAGSGWPEGASDAQLDDYADYKLAYGAYDRVTEVKTKGGKYTYSFAYDDSNHADGINNWKRLTTVTHPDSSSHDYYFNYVAQLMLRMFRITGFSDLYYQKFDANNRLDRQAGTSAVSSVTPSTASLVSLRTDAGLIHDYTYTNAGYLEAVDVRKGTSGNPVRLFKRTYTSHDVGAGTVDIYVLSKEEIFRGESAMGSDPSTTEYTYTWWQDGATDTYQMKVKTTKLPKVTGAENGDNIQYTEETHYDEYGFVTKTVDAKGVVTTYEYDGPTAAVIKMTQDEGTDTSVKDYLNLETDYQVDNLGRVTEELGPKHTIDLAGSGATEIRRARWTYYKDDVDERWEVNGYIKVSGASEHTINPVLIQKFDVDDGSGARRTEQIAADYSGVAGKPPDNHDFTQGTYLRWSTEHYDKGGEMTHSRVYYSIPNTGPGDYDQTDYGYDSMGRRDEVTTPGGTIQKTVFNEVNWVMKHQVGTDPGSGPSNLVDVLENEYTGDAGEDGMVTKVILPVDATSGNNREVLKRYDWRNRLEEVERSNGATVGEQILITKYSYDNRSLVTHTKQYHTSVSAANLFAEQETGYDSRSRVYQDKTYGVNSDGSQEGSIQTENYYDEVGDLVRRVLGGANAMVTVKKYDALRRTIQRVVGYEDGTTITDPGALSDVVVMGQSNYKYDDASNRIKTIMRVRFDDATGTGQLEDIDTQPKARISYSGSYPDALGRQQAGVDVGTNTDSNGDPAVWSRPTTIPTRSDDVLVTSTEYDDAGEMELIIDPKETETKQEYDNAGRRTKLIENYQGSESSGVTTDRVTRFEYNADSNLKKLIAENADTGEQVTEWVYGVTTTGGSGLNSNLLLGEKIYPTNVTKKYLYEYNRQGQAIEMTDQNGTVHDYNYDGMGRLTEDHASALGDKVDGAVRKITRSYNDRGLVEKVTSEDNAAVVVNQVEYTYNDFLQVSTEAQDHDTTVGSATPEVIYDYADGTSNTIRPTKVTYPGGEEVILEYTATANDKLSRLQEVVRGPAGSSEQTLSSYRYLGLDAVVGIEYGTANAAEFTYENGGIGDAGDKYTGLDRFGRVVENHWKTSTTDLQYTKYGYDRVSNRIWRENVQAGASNDQDNYYEYDGLYQIENWKRGILDKDSAGTPTGMASPVVEHQFTNDETGNITDFVDGVNSIPDLDQTRVYNQSNELTNITNPTGVIDPTYDDNGNTTKVSKPSDWTITLDLTWDAWNRLVEVDESGGGTHTYAYDGLHRRVSKNDGSTTRNFYYNRNRQVIEEQVSGTTKVTYFWGVRNLSDLVMRDRPDDEGERYALQDLANVVAYTNNAGIVQKRISYDAHGAAIFLTAAWTSSANSEDLSILYRGSYFDVETDFYRVRSSYYHPGLGRWLSRGESEEIGVSNTYIFSENSSSWISGILSLDEGAPDVENPLEDAFERLERLRRRAELWILILEIVEELERMKDEMERTRRERERIAQIIDDLKKGKIQIVRKIIQITREISQKEINREKREEREGPIEGGIAVPGGGLILPVPGDGRAVPRPGPRGRVDPRVIAIILGILAGKAVGTHLRDMNLDVDVEGLEGSLRHLKDNQCLCVKIGAELVHGGFWCNYYCFDRNGLFRGLSRMIVATEEECERKPRFRFIPCPDPLP